MTLEVVKFEKEKVIVFHAPNPSSAYLVTVQFEFLRKGGKTILRAVTFPDSGCANFYVTSSNTADLAILDSIAQSFRPRGEIKTAARPVCY